MASTTLESGRYRVTPSRPAPRYARSLLEASLDPLVTTADVARNGEVALEMFVASAYDVVLMDVQTPIMDRLLRHTQDSELVRYLDGLRVEYE